MSAAKAKGLTMVRKITPKIIMGSKPKLIDGKRTELATFAGVARRADSVTTSYGQSYRFIGEFVAVNLQTGEAFESNRAFFPRIVEEELLTPVQGDGECEFAFKLVIVPDEKSSTGYVYINEAIHEAQRSDKMQALAKLIGVDMKKQLAPPPETVKETKASDDKAGKDKGGKGK